MGNPQEPEPPVTKSPDPKIVSKSVSIEAAFSGPLPHPAILRGYEDACPGAADRIIAMAERQGEHRRSMESTAMEIAHEEMRREFQEARNGQICGVIVTLAFIIAGVLVLLKGHTVEGLLLSAVVGGIPALVSIFLRIRMRPAPSEPQPPPADKRPPKKR